MMRSGHWALAPLCTVTLAAFTPVAWAGEAVPTTPQTPLAQRNRGTLSIPNDSFDFGYVARASRVSHTYIVKNVGDDTLFINKVHVTCGCTSAPLTKNKVAPGDRVPIDVSFNSGKMSGHVRKTVTIYSSDGKQPQTSIEFTANVGEPPPTVMYQPTAGVDLASFSTAQPTQGKVALTNLGTAGATLKVVSTAPSFLEASFSASRIEPRQAADLTVRAKQGAPVGKFSGSVTVIMEGGAGARLSIPVSGEITAN